MPLLNHFHKLEKLQSPTRAKPNPSFQYFSESGKRSKYSLSTPKHQNPNFESKDKWKNDVRI